MNSKFIAKPGQQRFIIPAQLTIDDWMALQEHRREILRLVQTGKDENGKDIAIDEVMAIMQTELTAGNIARDIHEARWNIQGWWGNV